MTSEEILREATDKAIENGYDRHQVHCFFAVLKKYEEYEEFKKMIINAMLVDHSFAKAIWGEEDMWDKTKCNCGGVDFHIGGFDRHKLDCDKCKCKRGYKYHLQNMVLKKEPLKYLEKYL